MELIINDGGVGSFSFDVVPIKKALNSYKWVFFITMGANNVLVIFLKDFWSYAWLCCVCSPKSCLSKTFRPPPKKRGGSLLCRESCKREKQVLFYSSMDGCVSHSSRRGAVGVPNKEQKELERIISLLKWLDESEGLILPLNFMQAAGGGHTTVSIVIACKNWWIGIC